MTISDGGNPILKVLLLLSNADVAPDLPFLDNNVSCVAIIFHPMLMQKLLCILASPDILLGDI
eukprot:scaffold86069_cov71-Attheya_sp.AAC.1